MLDRSMERLTLSCYGVELLVVDEAQTGLCRRLTESLPPQFVPIAQSAAPSATYRVTKGDDVWRITRDGVIVCEEAFASDLLHYIRQDIDRYVAQQSSRMLFVHAGVVGWRGRAIVIPGRSHTGKSTLVAELVRRGAVYYSDEYAVLDEEGRVHPYSRTPVLRDDAESANDLRLVREDESLEPLPIALIVAGDYRDGVAWRPNVVRGARAVLPLIDGTVLAREEPAAMLRAAARIGEDVIALMGPRPDAADVSAQLLDLLDDAIVSRGLAADERQNAGLATDLAGVAERRFQSKDARRPPTDRRLAAARYVRMLDFLSPEEHARVLAHALACERDFQESGIVGQRGENTLNYGARRSRTLMKGRLEEIWEIFERRLSGILAGVRGELGTAYFRVGKVERQLTAHGRGGFFVPHTDTGHPVAATRRISAVYYFHGQPQRFSGGELRLYDTWVTPTGSTGAGTYTTLAPVDNSLVFFPSGAFHEVRTVQSDSDAFADSRFTVTIWFHEQQAPLTLPANDASADRSSSETTAAR